MIKLVCCADKINEQTPILLQGDATEKAIYLGVDPDGNRIFMAKPGMRLVVLEEPPADVPRLSAPHISSLVNSGASLLEALRNADTSPDLSDVGPLPINTKLEGASSSNTLDVVATSSEPFHLFYRV